MLRALREFAVAGPSTTIPFSEAVLRHPIFVAGQAGTSFVEEHQEDLQAYMKEAGPSSVPLSIAAPADEYRSFDVEVNRKLYRVRVAESRSREEISSRPRRATAARPRLDGNAVTSPMHGTVIAITRQPGEAVREGETLFIIEAMKMENEVAAHVGGTVASLDVQLGETVESGQRLGTIE